MATAFFTCQKLSYTSNSFVTRVRPVG